MQHVRAHPLPFMLLVASLLHAWIVALLAAIVGRSVLPTGKHWPRRALARAGYFLDIWLCTGILQVLLTSMAIYFGPAPALVSALAEFALPVLFGAWRTHILLRRTG